MLDQVGEELAAPAHAAFEKCKMQIGEAPRHAAQEQALGDGVAGGGEMADMVEGEVGGRIAQTEAAAAGMEGGRDAEFAAFLPNRVVVVIAVDAQPFESHGESRDRWIGAGRCWNRTGKACAEHADLGAKLLGGELELGNRLIGRVHRDDRGRGQPIAELGEIIGSDDVEPAHDGPARLVVGDARDAEPAGRVDHAEIDADLVEPVVEHARHHRRGAVAGVGRLAAPIALHGDAALLAFGDRQAERVGCAPLAGEEAIGGLVTGCLAHFLGEDRGVFDPVAVSVDDGMV